MFGWLKRKKRRVGLSRDQLSKELDPGLDALFALEVKEPVDPDAHLDKKRNGYDLPLARVPKWCHPGKAGKRLLCPEPNCIGTTHVYNFAWSLRTCEHCGETNKKLEWYLAPKDHRIDARDHAFVEKRK